METIRFSITHEKYAYQPKDSEVKAASEIVEKELASIKQDVIKWKGLVDFKCTMSDNFNVTAHCDNKEIETKMQRLLTSVIHTLQ